MDEREQGSEFWVKLEELKGNPGLQMALILDELPAVLNGLTWEDFELWEEWVAGRRKHLPEAGGFLNQPSRVMKIIRRFDHAAVLYDKLRQAGKEADKLQDNILNAANALRTNSAGTGGAVTNRTGKRRPKPVDEDEAEEE